jgi:hypothetical protein
MGFSLLFNIFDAYIKEENIFLTEDINSDMDRVIERAYEVLISNGGEVLGKEQLKMRICYPSLSSDELQLKHPQIKTEIFLFNQSENRVSHVLCRNKTSDDDFEVVRKF